MMPFRVPSNYESLTCSNRDYSSGELWNYILWLRAELATAEEALKHAKTPKPTKPKPE